MRIPSRVTIAGSAVAMLVAVTPSLASAATPDWTMVGSVVHHEAACGVFLNYESLISTQGTPVVQLHNSKKQLEISVPARDSSGVVGYTTTGWRNPTGTSRGTGDFDGSSWKVVNTYDAFGSIRLNYNFPAASNGIASVTAGTTTVGVAAYYTQVAVGLKPNA